MMRSLFSGVAGLTTHQTRMDVIGNNIANVNTTAYKSQSMVFNDLLYQTTQAASGANANTGRGGINPRQIGLGAKTGAISTAISTQGSAQSTNNPWDVMIEGDSFFVVSDGSQNFFTRDGSFTVDGAGNLVMASLGYTVMGWQVDPQTGDIRSDVVSALQIMNTDNLTAPPEATTKAYLSGILDKTDPSINSDAGAVRTFTIYDAQGYSYMVKMSFHGIGSEDNFRVQLDDILDGTGVSLVKKYGLENIEQIATFGASGDTKKTSVYGLDKDAKFDGTSKFNVTLAFSEILEGYAQNSLVVAAGDNVSVTVPADKGTVTAGTTDGVTVHGKVTLTKEQLQKEPYSLIYDEKTNAYYQKPTAADATLGTKVDDLAKYLADLGGVLDGVENVKAISTPNGEAGQYDIEFDAKFTPTMDATRDGSSFGLELNMPDDEKDILKYVYNLEDSADKDYKISYIAPNGSAQITETQHTRGMEIMFDHDSGKFVGIGGEGKDTATLTFNSSTSSISGEIIDLSQFSNVDIDFSSANNYGNGKKCTLEFTPGSKDSTASGKGRKIGELIGVEIGQDGKITASYDNGLTKLLGQIAVAEFANASGLAKAGNNLYSATQNSGEFDGVGKDITASGGSMTSGVLEMSNVDLSSEFTTMITTQRGFQANSRIITVSDTLLEELVNLKR